MSKHRIALMAGGIALAVSTAQAQTPVGAPVAVFAPNYYVGFGAVFMSRANTGPNTTLVTIDGNEAITADDIPLLRIRDLDISNFKPGFEIKGGMRLSDSWWLAAEFLWISRVSAARAGSGPADNIGFPGGEASARTNFGDSDVFDAKLRSDMLTARLGARYRFRPWLTFTGGLRYMHVADRLELAIDELVGTDDHRFSLQTLNHLAGGEIGAILRHEFLPGLTGSLAASVGAFANFTTVNRRFVDGDAAGIGTFTRNQSRTGFSFVTEGRATLEYRFHHLVAAYIGYRVLFATGIATAAKNGDTSIAADGFPASLGLARGSVLYHGGMAGLKISW